MQKTVLVVDDSSFMRTLVKQILGVDEAFNVIGEAGDGVSAVALAMTAKPDIIILDIEMPKMDGLSFLEKIMALRPMPVVMVSTLTQKGASETIRALEIGAFDYVGKPGSTFGGEAARMFGEELVEKVRAASQANLAPRRHGKAAQATNTVLDFHPASDPANTLIAIGSSTGGVEALRDIFQALPANLPPIVIVQHMPEAFTPSFAARLNSLSQMSVAEARNGVRLEVGHAYLAPGGRQMTVKKSGHGWSCQVAPGATVSGHCPSVDVLFHSIAAAAGGRAVGIILTGMGKDGAVGMLKMREAGAYNIGQSKESCVVYGMPKAAFAAGAVHREFPLSVIAEQVVAYLEHKGRSSHAAV